MNKFMQMAIDEAKIGVIAGDGGPLGDVIVKDCVVIGKGHNNVIRLQDPTCHGEIMAIHEACEKLGTFDLSGCEIYTTGEPCPMCLGAILWANIGKIYYGCNIDDTEKIGFRVSDFYQIYIGDKPGFMHEMVRDSCHKLYDHYAGIKDKQSY